MNINISNRIQTKYGLTKYQVAQIKFLFMTLASEFSKMILMGIIFHKYLSLYLFSLLIMLCLRCTTGGLHFYTYWGCFLMSFSYIGLTLILTYMVTPEKYVQIFLLLVSLIVCYKIKPITSKYRPEQIKEKFNLNRNRACRFIFFYTIILYIIPDNRFVLAGFWVIILHTLQLMAAKILKRKELT